MPTTKPAAHEKAGLSGMSLISLMAVQRIPLFERVH
jgi:hypothetical protein